MTIGYVEGVCKGRIKALGLGGLLQSSVLIAFVTEKRNSSSSSRSSSCSSYSSGYKEVVI